MKQTLISLLLLVALTAAAQEKDWKQLREKFFDAKVSELAQKLELTEEQKAGFVPIYRQYNDEMRATMGPPFPRRGHHKDGAEQKDGDAKKKPLTDEERLARTKMHMERQQKAQAIRLKYIDEFSKVLTPKQVDKFYKVEYEIQKKLMKRHKHPRGKHPKTDNNTTQKQN